MHIGIIGAGKIGKTAARLFVKAGHSIAICNSKTPETLIEFTNELGSKALSLSKNDVALYGEIILLAVPWSKPEALPEAKNVTGKIVIDAMNHYKPDLSLYDLGNSTASEETAKRLQGSRIVKAFNTIYYLDLMNNGDVDLPLEKRKVIFLAGDDDKAKEVVKELIKDIGFAPFDTGSLREGGKKQQPGSMIYNNQMNLEEAEKLINNI